MITTCAESRRWAEIHPELRLGIDYRSVSVRTPDVDRIVRVRLRRRARGQDREWPSCGLARERLGCLVDAQPSRATPQGGSFELCAALYAPIQILLARRTAGAPVHSGGLLDWIDLLQWPAMVVTVLAAWLIGSLNPRRRTVGFWFFLLSNLLWVIWGWQAHAWALIVLQVCLALMNIRGVKKNDHPQQA
jgi:hypothetical protein